MINFETVDELLMWLLSKGIDVLSWGQGSYKSVKDLWLEVQSGESQIYDKVPYRTVRVVQMIIRNENSEVLIENYQEFFTRERRYRGVFPSEKMQIGEDFISATLRGLSEELQLDESDVDIVKSTSRAKEEIRESNAYPDLLTKYIIFSVEVIARDLPSVEFSTPETSHSRTDHVIRHYWEWRTEA